MNKETFIKKVEKLGIEITPFMLKQLDIYYHFLVDYNEKVNLTNITKEEDVYLKHFYDSITVIKAHNLEGKTLVDVGTGAGFPGIVLKIMVPSLKLTLVDSLNKRIIFLNELIKKLDLQEVETVHARFEEYSLVKEEAFDYVTARAVSNISFLAEATVRLLKVGGSLILMRGSNDYLEEDREKLLKALNLKLKSTDEFLLPVESSKRTIITLEKLAKTNKKYPRKLNEMKNKPL